MASKRDLIVMELKALQGGLWGIWDANAGTYVTNARNLIHKFRSQKAAENYIAKWLA